MSSAAGRSAAPGAAAGGGFRRRREAEDPNNTWNMQLFAALLSKSFDDAATLLEKGANVNHLTTNAINASGTAPGSGGLAGVAAGGAGSAGGAASLEASLAGGGGGAGTAAASPVTTNLERGGGGAGGDKNAAAAHALAQAQQQRCLLNFLRAVPSASSLSAQQQQQGLAVAQVPLCIALVFRASGVASFGDASPGAPATIAIADAIEALKWLSEHGCNLDAALDADAFAPTRITGNMFHVCVHFDWSATLEKLLRLRLALRNSNGSNKGSSLFAAATGRDAFGASPTAVAVQQGKLELAKLLMRNLVPFDFLAKADADRTALARACAANDVSLVELLLQLGDDPDQLDLGTGRTLVQVAWSAFDRQGLDPALAAVPVAHTGKGGAAAQQQQQQQQTAAAAAASLVAPPASGPGAASSQKEGGKGDAPQMQLLPVLLNRGLDANARSADGRTALTYALDTLPRHLFQQQLDAYLLHSGGDVDAADATTGRTLLMAAVDACDADLMRRLVLEHHADVNAVDGFGASALHRACAAGRRIGLVEQLLAFENVKINAVDAEGQTPLHRAALRGRAAVVKLLISKEACDVNVADSAGGNTPLHLAVDAGHADIVDLLVGLNTNPRPVSADKKRGGAAAAAAGGGAAGGGKKSAAAESSGPRVQIDAENKERLTPLELAVRRMSSPASSSSSSSSFAVIQKLLVGAATVHRVAAGTQHSLLQQAVLARSLPLTTLLLQRGADIHHRCAADRTALHYATQLQDMALVEELIGAGAAVDAQDSVQLRSPLHIAAADLHVELVQLLLQHKASVNVTDANFQTALHIVCDRGAAASAAATSTAARATAIGTALLAAGARPAARDAKQRMPLHYACAANNAALVTALLQCNVPVWARDADAVGAMTPLHTACIAGALEVVELLCGLIEARNADPALALRSSADIAAALAAAEAAGRRKIAAGESNAKRAGADNARPTDPLMALHAARMSLDLEGAASAAARNVFSAEELSTENECWRNALTLRDGNGRTAMLAAAEAGKPAVGKVLARTMRAVQQIRRAN